MLKTSSNGTQATTAIKFSLRPTAETLADLSRPIDPRHLKTRKQGTATLTYCPWNTIARHLHHRAPGWCWEVQSVQEVGGAVVVTGRLTIPTADGDLLHYSAVCPASSPLADWRQSSWPVRGTDRPPVVAGDNRGAMTLEATRKL
ncbi:hypothetical protein KBY75_05860, partial [Cyanobium sp. T1G-Tous]|nr:hypothetical protein [Cyanobium sp. T1G-Tous]